MAAVNWAIISFSGLGLIGFVMWLLEGRLSAKVAYSPPDTKERQTPE